MTAVYLQRDIRQLLAMDKPLVTARAAIDAVYVDKTYEIQQLHTYGTKLIDLLDYPLRSPLHDKADVLLEASPDTENHSWLEWFHLRAAMASAQQIVFFPFAFQSVDDAPVRHAIHTRAYNIYGELLSDALDAQATITDEDEVPYLRGTVTELAVLALAHKVNKPQSGVKIGDAKNDYLRKVDASYRVHDSRRRTYGIVDAQIKTSQPRFTSKDPIEYIIGNQYLAQGRNLVHGAHLIVKDIQHRLTETDQHDLESRSCRLNQKLRSSRFLRLSSSI